MADYDSETEPQLKQPIDFFQESSFKNAQIQPYMEPVLRLKWFPNMFFSMEADAWDPTPDLVVLKTFLGRILTGVYFVALAGLVMGVSIYYTVSNVIVQDLENPTMQQVDQLRAQGLRPVCSCENPSLNTSTFVTISFRTNKMCEYIKQYDCKLLGQVREYTSFLLDEPIIYAQPNFQLSCKFLQDTCYKAEEFLESTRELMLNARYQSPNLLENGTVYGEFLGDLAYNIELTRSLFGASIDAISTWSNMNMPGLLQSLFQAMKFSNPAYGDIEDVTKCTGAIGDWFSDGMCDNWAYKSDKYVDKTDPKMFDPLGTPQCGFEGGDCLLEAIGSGALSDPAMIDAFRRSANSDRAARHMFEATLQSDYYLSTYFSEYKQVRDGWAVLENTGSCMYDWSHASEPKVLPYLPMDTEPWKTNLDNLMESPKLYSDLSSLGLESLRFRACDKLQSAFVEPLGAKRTQLFSKSLASEAELNAALKDLDRILEDNFSLCPEFPDWMLALSSQTYEALKAYVDENPSCDLMAKILPKVAIMGSLNPYSNTSIAAIRASIHELTKFELLMEHSKQSASFATSKDAVRGMYIEFFDIGVDYVSYFEACNPSKCSIRQKPSDIVILSTLFGIIGGLKGILDGVVSGLFFWLYNLASKGHKIQRKMKQRKLNRASSKAPGASGYVQEKLEEGSEDGHPKQVPVTTVEVDTRAAEPPRPPSAMPNTKVHPLPQGGQVTVEDL